MAEEKYCPYCGRKRRKKGWDIKISKDGKEVYGSTCDGNCEKSESKKTTEKKLLKG